MATLNSDMLESYSLLGDFNEKNKYVLPQKVTIELVKCKKTIVKEEDDIIFLEANSENNKYIFELHLKYLDDNVCVARLYLIEFFVKNDSREKLCTYLLKYTSIDQQNFKDNAKKQFRITEEKHENQSMLCDDALNEKKKIYKTAFNELVMLDKKFVMQTLKILQDEKVGRELFDKLKQKLVEMDNDASKYIFWIKSKEIVMQFMENVKSEISAVNLNNYNLLMAQLKVQNIELYRKFKKAEKDRKQKLEFELIYQNLNEIKKDLNKQIEKQASTVQKEIIAEDEKYDENIKDENENSFDFFDLLFPGLFAWHYSVEAIDNWLNNDLNDNLLLDALLKPLEVALELVQDVFD